MLSKIKVLNGNVLKLFAAFCMVLDHIGFFGLLPGYYYPLRIIGRIAFPIFAYTVAEGCKYTKNKWAHFSLLFSIAVLCQIVYYVADHSLEMSVLITFSFSVLMIYAMQNFKANLFNKDAAILDKITSGGLFIATVLATQLITSKIYTDYGFYGCMVPVIIAIPDFKNVDAPDFIKYVDNDYIRLIFTALGIWFMLLDPNRLSMQAFAFLALIPLFLYNGKKGKWKLKYFFYFFYPLHLVLLQFIANPNFLG